MNKKEIVTQYQDLYSDLYTALEGLQKLMSTEEFNTLVSNPDGDEDVEMMYGEFGVLVENISSNWY